LSAAPAAAFVDLEHGEASYSRRRRSGGGWWKEAILGLSVLAVIAIVTAVCWPQIQDSIGQSNTQTASRDEQDRPVVNHEKAPRKSDSTDKGEQPKKERPKKDVKKDAPSKDVSRKDVAKREELPKKEITKKEPPVSPPVDPPIRSASTFPRRALVVSVNNYLYLNPINYGLPGPGARNVHALLDRFTTGLRIPREQIAELSDAAPRGQARPPVKAVIQRAIGDFLDTSRPQDRIILLMIAHTVEIDDEPYLVPLDGDLETKPALISLTWIYERLGKCPARQKVFILDTCRFDPTRGQERPGSGALGSKLDAKLMAPPPGVEVWTACQAGQRSYEFDSSTNGNVNGGLFVDCLYQALARGIEGTIQRPEEPILLKPLVEKVNARMKGELAQLKLEQVSRLAGQEAEDGAAYDPKQPPPPKLVIQGPDRGKDDIASIEQVASILKDVDVPPLKMARDDMLIRPESMPPFSTKVLDLYKPDGETTPFREAVQKARKTLHAQLKGKRLQEEWQKMGDDNRHKAFLKEYQEKEVARTIRELEEAFDDLKQAGKDRKEEKSKRWQANYDYVYARLAAQIAYLYEYDSALGEMRKDLPEPGPNGWRLASQKKLQGDPAGRKLANESAKLLDKIAKDHAGTPWEVLAKRDRLSNLGLKWQPNK
jgi:hypothetical protein